MLYYIKSNVFIKIHISLSKNESIFHFWVNCPFNYTFPTFIKILYYIILYFKYYIKYFIIIYNYLYNISQPQNNRIFNWVNYHCNFFTF